MRAVAGVAYVLCRELARMVRAMHEMKVSWFVTEIVNNQRDNAILSFR